MCRGCTKARLKSTRFRDPSGFFLASSVVSLWGSKGGDAMQMRKEGCRHCHPAIHDRCLPRGGANLHEPTKFTWTRPDLTEHIEIYWGLDNSTSPETCTTRIYTTGRLDGLRPWAHGEMLDLLVLWISYHNKTVASQYHAGFTIVSGPCSNHLPACQHWEQGTEGIPTQPLLWTTASVEERGRERETKKGITKRIWIITLKSWLAMTLASNDARVSRVLKIACFEDPH